jgi:hypothetical protein
MAEISTIGPQAEPGHPAELWERQRFPVVWQRLALLGILLLAVCMDFYRLGQNGFDSYYPPAVQGMIDNSHNFWFAAYDPGGLIGARAVTWAAESGRLCWLLLSDLAVGIGFNVNTNGVGNDFVHLPTHCFVLSLGDFFASGVMKTCLADDGKTGPIEEL